MARRTPRIVPGDLEYIPISRDEQLAHAEELHRHGDHHLEQRAEYYTEAAEYYAAAGVDDTAEQLYRAALADGGEVSGSIHGFYADFLLERGRDDEALALIDTARKQRPDNPDVFVIITETLDLHGHHRAAADWATRGLVHLLGSLAEITADDLVLDPDARLLAADRLRARRNADLPADHIDGIIAPTVDALEHHEP